MVGDLKYGRTVHSLAEALTMFGAEVTFVAPSITADAQGDGEAGREARGKAEAQVQAGGGHRRYRCPLHHPDPEGAVPRLAEYQKVAGTYRVDNSTLREAKTDLIIMHPLPRVDEIAPEVDYTPHAKYFEQAFNGVPVRMALLMLVLGGEL